MRRLAPHGISEDVLHSLWIKRISISVRCSLSAREGIELTRLAEIADRILDYSTQSQVMAANSPRSELRTSSQQPGLNFSEGRLTIANVEKQLSELSTTVKSIQTSMKTLANTSESRARSRTRSTTPPGGIDLSFSSQIGDNAQLCLLPCSYKSSELSETGATVYPTSKDVSWEKGIHFLRQRSSRQCHWGGTGCSRLDRTSCAGRRMAHRSHDRSAISACVPISSSARTRLPSM
jgi:hypothetical protein